jgi:hypothetical protein
MKALIQILKSWLPLAATVTLLCGIIYITVQQTYRSNANDPQNQMAEDAVTSLRTGADPKTIVSSGTMEISQSLKPYLIVYDDQGNPLASDGFLNGKIPTLPNGVLDYTRSHGGNAITWQPRSGVRSALVILPFLGTTKGCVVAGRSLRMVEERESMLVSHIGIGWVVSMVLLLILAVLIQVTLKRSTSETSF